MKPDTTALWGTPKASTNNRSTLKCRVTCPMCAAERAGRYHVNCPDGVVRHMLPGGVLVAAVATWSPYP